MAIGPGRRDVEIGIAIPCHGSWTADFGLDLTRLVAALAVNPSVGVKVSQNISSLLPAQREWLAGDVREAECTHILCVDTDMSFPPNAAIRLLAHGKDVVGVNYARKKAPFLPTAMGMEGRHIQSHGRTGLEPVMSLGLGLCLIKTSVFDDLPHPWFPILWSDEREGYIGEDVAFCHLLRARKGIDLWVDHGLSNEVGHIGSFRYTMAMSHLAREKNGDG